MNEKQYFNKISASEASSLILHIQKNNTPCICKIFDNSTKTFFLKNNKFEIQIFKKSKISVKNEKVIVSFEALGDYFFFETVATSIDPYIENEIGCILVMSQSVDIYKLQRRNDFRVPILNHLKQNTRLKNHSDFKTELRDLSLGGCKIAITTNSKLNITIDTETELYLSILDFEEKDLSVSIKFIDYSLESKIALIGLKFLELNSDQTTMLRNTLLQLDRMARNKSND
jgi:hypothetical protein